MCSETSRLVFFPSNRSGRMHFQCEEIPQIMHFLFLPPHRIENTIHCSSNPFLPLTIRPLSSRLGTGFDITDSKGNVLTALLIRQQRFIVITLTLEAKHSSFPAPTCPARGCPGSARPEGWDSFRLQSEAHRARGLCLGFGIVKTWILSQILWAVANCMMFWDFPELSALPSISKHSVNSRVIFSFNFFVQFEVHHIHTNLKLYSFICFKTWKHHPAQITDFFSTPGNPIMLFPLGLSPDQRKQPSWRLSPQVPLGDPSTFWKLHCTGPSLLCLVSFP